MENLYNKASLVLTPQMVEAGKVYSMKPEDRKGDFTFSRSTAATRVNASGNIEKETGNLLTQSNTFSSWSFTTGSSVTGNQAGYDGTNDAWLLTDSGNIGSYAMYNTINDTGILTASIYAKAASTSEIELDLFGTPTPAVKVNLISGNITSVSASNIDAKSVDVGNGWYRISLTCNISSLLYIRIGCDGAGSIYIQDAQLEQGLVARDYIETTTTAIYGGITDNVPRLDYTDSSCPALLLEPQRTNNITQSEYFGAWSTLNSSVTNNSTTSPEGVTNAALCEYSITSGNGYIRLAHTAAETISFYIKYKDVQWVMVYLSGLGAGKFIDIQNGVVGGNVGSGATAEIVDAGNDWKRVILKSSSANITQTSIYAAASDGSYASITLSGGIYLYGAQAEAGSYATSYIPTYGSAVTRNGDAASKTGISSLIGQTEGTLFVEANLTDVDSTTTRGIAELNNGGTLSRITLFRNSNGTIRLFVRDGGTAQMDETYATPPSGVTKIAIGYAANDIVFYVNGTQVATDTAATIPACSDLDLGQMEGNLTKTLGDSVKQALLFKTRLSNEELAQLTAL